MHLELRRASKNDLVEVIEVIKDSYHRKYAAAGEFYSVQHLTDPNYETENGPYQSIGVFVADMISDLPRKLKKPFEFYVAELKNEIAGFIIIEKNNKSFWINNVMVKRKFRKMGVGQFLFNSAGRNRRPLYLWVNSRNPAKKFWGRLGFKKVLQETLMIKK